ncbi:MAG: hypothetical protein E7097_02670 [Bacteroides sp.]|nr:hypothetical protein [Bacteroides sp.]
MSYPLISDYVSSILSAEDNFKELTNLRPVLDDEGEPIMSSGNFAVVFKMKDEQTGKSYAVKCFLKEEEGRAESYKLIEEELEFVSSNYLTPIRYMEDELFVDSNNTEDTEFPVLLMDWIEGVTLEKYIRTHLGYTYGLAMLTYRFSKLASWLLAQPFAHGDLKSDNILVKEDGSLVLVDYDGMYVPTMKGQKAREIGSPDFRHPKRTDDNFDEHIDDFSIASILLSLKAISLNPRLLNLYGGSDRLLFSQKDYLDLGNSYVINAIRPLMIDDELNISFALFLLANSKMKLSIVSFKLLNMKRPTKETIPLATTNDLLKLSDSDVQLEMGFRFYHGFGVPKDYKEAFRYFILSAEQGNARAQRVVGHCYHFGQGVESNDSIALDWFFKAAEHGDIMAQNNIGACYHNGIGIPQNYSEAIKWYKKAALKGHSLAQRNLGCLYYDNKYGNQDFKEAVKWFSKAAEQGHADAQYKLGICYESGRGVVLDGSIAKEWYMKAAKLGHKEAINKLKKQF